MKLCFKRREQGGKMSGVKTMVKDCERYNNGVGESMNFNNFI